MNKDAGPNPEEKLNRTAEAPAEEPAAAEAAVEETAAAETAAEAAADGETTAEEVANDEVANDKVVDDKVVDDKVVDEADEADGEFDIEDYLRQFKELQEEQKKLAAEKEQLEARLLRLQADFDNFRRRSRSDAEEAGRKAASSLAESLLTVIDNFERALAAMDDSADRQGVEMIMKQLLGVLNAAGLEEIAALDAEFDPKLHHAVSQIETDEEHKNKVVAVLQKGYTFGGRLLRAPMVQVGV